MSALKLQWMELFIHPCGDFSHLIFYKPLCSVQDINECAEGNGGCNEVCENTAGSFFCACEGDERALSSDGKSCIGDTSH